MIWSRGHQLQSGQYRIIRLLGGGKFGLTYLAEDYFLGRQVVIKTPNREFQVDQEYKKFIRRFQREGQVLAKIDHPNVIQVIEFFQEVDISCLVMAYVNGETLNERIHNQGRLSEKEAVEHFRKLAAALQTVHEKGLIHCDIHPGNIMLRRQSGEPVLIDFGSAKSLQPAASRVTTTMTHNYFTPYEQQDKSRKRQATLDVYALAATLYFAVTGEEPQPAFNRKAYGDTLKSPQQYQPGLSDWLNQAILQGMTIEPEKRPQSMQAWLGFLQPSQSKQKPTQLLQLQMQIKLALRRSFSTIRETSSALRKVFVSILETLAIRGLQIFSNSMAKLNWVWDQLSTSSFILLLGFVLLGYLPMGILLRLTDNVAVVVAVAWAEAVVWAFILARDGHMARVAAGSVAWVGIAYIVFVLVGAEAFVWGLIGSGVGALIGAWAGTTVVSEALVGTVVVPFAASIVWGVFRVEVWAETIRVMAWFVPVVWAGVGGGIFLWFITFTFLKERYDFNFWFSFIIFGITSTLGLVLGGVLGWWLKLQGVSLPFFK